MVSCYEKLSENRHIIDWDFITQMFLMQELAERNNMLQ
jgi:hypothetical protein